jgi:hypothetical protein
MAPPPPLLLDRPAPKPADAEPAARNGDANDERGRDERYEAPNPLGDASATAAAAAAAAAAEVSDEPYGDATDAGTERRGG